MSKAVTTPTPVLAAERPQAQSEADIRHNYWVTIIEGGLFMGGVAFINPNTILPDIVNQLGGSPLLISLMPVMMSLGYMLPSILTAHWVDMMPRFKPLTVVCGTFQRLPYLFAAIALFFAGDSRLLAISAVALAPLISGIAGGISSTAWQQLYARCIPESRRSSVTAYRYLISCTLGMLAGSTILYLLHTMPRIQAYATLHLITFGFVTASMVFFCTTREPSDPLPARHSLTLWQNLLLMPQLAVRDRAFRHYLLSRFLRNGGGIITPFLAIYARQHLHQPESYLGQLLLAQMIGSILGNLVAAPIGDKAGGKLVHQIGVGLFIVLCAWSMFAGTSLEFLTIFWLFGFASNMAEVGNFTLLLELAPQQNRSTYLALAGIINLPAILASSWLSAILWEYNHGILLLALGSIVSLAACMLTMAPVRDPRCST